jgi:hypothetical protein
MEEWPVGALKEVGRLLGVGSGELLLLLLLLLQLSESGCSWMFCCSEARNRGTILDFGAAAAADDDDDVAAAAEDDDDDLSVRAARAMGEAAAGAEAGRAADGAEAIAVDITG